jgi:predicted transcriptional regulator
MQSAGRVLGLWAAAALLVSVWARADAPRVWVESATDSPRLRTHVSVLAPPVFPASETVRFPCVVESANRRAGCTLMALIENEAGEPVYEGSLTLDLDIGETRRTFVWEPPELAPGVYTLRAGLRHPLDGQLAAHTVTLRALTDASVADRLDRASARLAELDSHLDRLAAQGHRPPHAVVRGNIAADFLARARTAHAAGDWLRADALGRYVEHTAGAALASMAFAGQSAATTAPLAQPPAATWAAEKGFLRAGAGPGFLVGVAGLSAPAPLVPELARYGLNWVVTDAPTEDATPDALTDALVAAGRHGLALTANLGLPGDASQPGGSLDLASAEGRRRALEAARAAGAALAGHEAALGAVLAEAPRFDFSGDPVRAAFAGYVRDAYGSVEAVNRVWRSHLLRWDEVVIERDYLLSEPRFVPPYLSQPAYRYDWQRFQHGIELRAFGELRDALRAESGVQAAVALANAGVRPDRGGSMADRELLSRAMGLSAVVGEVRPGTADHALQFPEPFLVPALLRSVAPDQALLATRLALDLQATPSVFDRFSFVYGALWNAIAFGANGVALAMAGDAPSLLDSAAGPFARPDVLEAAALARIDTNRLARPLDAIQRAPADIAILYSVASRIFADDEQQRTNTVRAARGTAGEDGENAYLASLRNAYEGAVYFGRNVRFISERQCAAGELTGVRVLIVPRMSAITDATFTAVEQYVAEGGVIVRQGRPFPYNERGVTRLEVLGYSPHTWLIRGIDTPTDYLDALDAIEAEGLLPPQPRPVDTHGYPLQGVAGRAAQVGDTQYLYLMNMRARPVRVHLSRGVTGGTNLVTERSVAFPHVLQPLQPMVLALPWAAEEDSAPAEAVQTEAELAPAGDATHSGRAPRAQERSLRHARP